MGTVGRSPSLLGRMLAGGSPRRRSRFGYPHHVTRERGVLPAFHRVETRIRVRERGSEVELERGDGAADRGGIPLDFDEVSDGGLVERHEALGEAPFLPALLVAERAAKSEMLEDRAELHGVMDSRLALLPRFDTLLETRRSLESEERLARHAAQPNRAARRRDSALGIVVEVVRLVVPLSLERGSPTSQTFPDGFEVRGRELDLDLP